MSDDEHRERAAALVAQMTRAEKIAQLQNAAPAIERLGVARHDFWNECLHGVARAGLATVFPQAIGLAATWDPGLLFRVATAISDEARAKHHRAVREGRFERYTGLTFWSPNLNLLRDPRWGRAQETYGEDPLLTGTLGVAFVRGLQGDDARFTKVVATAKHFAVHSGPESERHRFDARPSDRDLFESYLPHFEMVVREAKVASVMTAYNRVNGEPCSSHPRLFGILRETWGFDGYVVSDCDAIEDLWHGHGTVATPAEAAARALVAGCDLECGSTYRHLDEALERGLATEADLDRALVRIFTARTRLGMFDAPETVRWAGVPWSVVDSPEHRALAREAAAESIVLMKNDEGLLPLRGPCRLAVVGPSAESLDVLLGNYHGTPAEPVTLRAGIERGAPAGVSVVYARGASHHQGSIHEREEAARLAAASDVVVLCVGSSPTLEGEEGDVTVGGGDRLELALPRAQRDLVEAVLAEGRPVVVALTGGAAIDLRGPLERAGALLMTFFPGQAGGEALADVLFGRVSPSGRLPFSFYDRPEGLPHFGDYAMRGRTYRFATPSETYGFGHGLSYTRFAYRALRAEPRGGTIEVDVEVANVGARAGAEVVQLYVARRDADVPVPLRALAAFTRIELDAGASARVQLRAHPMALRVYDDEGRASIDPGTIAIAVGGRQPDAAWCYRDEDGVTAVVDFDARR